MQTASTTRTIPLFIEAFCAGQGDIIIGKRTFGEMPPKSQFGNRVGTVLLGWAMASRFPITRAATGCSVAM